MQRKWVLRTLVLTILLGVVILVASALLQSGYGKLRQAVAVQQLYTDHLSPDHPETLVLYTYSNSDPEYERNMHFFVRHGMAEGDGCEYVITVQQGRNILPFQRPLPNLPSNAQYMFHDDLCFDWGTFGWTLSNTTLDVSNYTWIIFINSSVRGPHLPAYWPSFVHWTNILTSRLVGKVKLVGSTISCEGTFLHGDSTTDRRQYPHVQSYLMATDQEGLKVLQEDGRIFECYESLHDAVWNGELGSSMAILNAGYTIDSLMLKYQGANWSNNNNWSCNAGLDPHGVDVYDGINLNPLEVVFVKVKVSMLQADWAAPKASQTHDRWLSHQGETAGIENNEYATYTESYRGVRVSMMTDRGSNCFNFEMYKTMNSLPFEDRAGLWNHFVQHGQFEPRTFEFKCGLAGRRHSPVDGQWYPVNASITGTMPANQKRRLSIHLKLIRNKLQWTAHNRLQQKLDAYPELADWLARVHIKQLELSRHMVQNQSAMEPQSHRFWQIQDHGSVKKRKNSIRRKS